MPEQEKLEELKKLIKEAIDEAKANKKECWLGGAETRATYNGAIAAFIYCLEMIEEKLKPSNHPHPGADNC